MNKITIRPSSLNTFVNCPYQWYTQYIMKQSTIPSARAAIGTAIHAGVEKLWTDSISKQSKILDNNLEDIVADKYKTLDKQGLQYDEGENQDSALLESVNGFNAYLLDIAPKIEIPDVVEHRYELILNDHPIVEKVAGTVDYKKASVIGDVKTSKRKIASSQYTLQQSVYCYLASKLGAEVITEANIQGIVLTKKPYGEISPMYYNIKQAVFIVNTLLETLKALHEGKIDPLLLFRGNPKYYLCSNKYCAIYYKCKFIKGE